MNLFDAEMLAKELMSRYIPDWHFGWMNEKRTNGRCYYREKTIRLSRHLTPLRSPEAVCLTIMHEIAHALTPGAGHGSAWKAQMYKFGLPANRCSQDSVDTSSISNWKAVCNSCGKISYMIRKPRNERSCGTCSNSFNRKYLLTFKRI